MEGNTRRRRRKDAPKPTTASRRGERPVGKGEATSTVHDIPNDVLELILLRLDSPVCLVRAACACKRWCRVVADTGFLARFRLLNAPCLVMGHYHNYGSPFFAPSPTPIIPITHSFSLDFVPAESGGTWEIVDSRDGLLLLFRNKHNHWRIQRHLFDPDLVVCEPQTRRYHPISMPEPDDQVSGRAYLGSFLLKGGTASMRMSNFKVILVLLREDLVDRDRGVPAARVYLGSNRSWHDINCAGNIVNIPRKLASFHFVGRANGSLYWAVEETSDALVLDEATAAVSLQALPVTVRYWHEGRCFRVFGGEDGTLRAVRLVNNTLSVFALRKGGAGDMDDEWVVENLVRLPENTGFGILGRTLIVAAHDTSVLVAPRHSTWLFSVDLKTMAVEHVRERSKNFVEGPAYPYKLPWPPTLKA